jgi:hypothetical protein
MTRSGKRSANLNTLELNSQQNLRARCDWSKCYYLAVDSRPTPEQYIASLNNYGNQSQIASVAKYAEKFAFFFSEKFFLTKMFEVLNQEMESRPELLGFRPAMQVVFEEMKSKELITTEDKSYVDWIYDEYVINLEIEKLRKLTDFLGWTEAKA